MIRLTSGKRNEIFQCESCGHLSGIPKMVVEHVDVNDAPIDMEKLEKVVDKLLKKRIDDLDRQRDVDSIVDFSMILQAKAQIQNYRTSRLAEEQLRSERSREGIKAHISAIAITPDHPHVDIATDVLNSLEEALKRNNVTPYFSITSWVNDMIRDALKDFDSRVTELCKKYGSEPDAGTTS